MLMDVLSDRIQRLGEAGIWLAQWIFEHSAASLVGAFVLAGLLSIAPQLRHSIRPSVALRLGPWSWTRRELCCGILIFGGRGSGKTSGGIRGIVTGLLQGAEKNFGGLVIDPKGDEYLWYQKVFASAARGRHVAVLRVEASGAPPAVTVNLFGDPTIPDSTYAQWLAAASKSLRAGSDEQAFFVKEAVALIAAVMTIFRWMEGRAASPLDILGAIRSPASLNGVHGRAHARVTEMGGVVPAAVAGAIEHIKSLGETSEAAEQLHGILATARTMVQFYSAEVCRVFFNPRPTHRLSDMDEGVLFVTSIPNRYEQARRMIGTLLKTVYYNHALNRYELPSEERYKRNLLVLVADEYQDVVTSAGSDHSDYVDLAKIRDSGCTVIAATQLWPSIVAALDNHTAEAKTVVGNFGTWFVFRAADPETARLCQDMLGTRKTQKKTYTLGGLRRTVSITEEETPRFSASDLLKLPTFCCVIKHERFPTPRKARLARIE